ncbi:MAG: DUF533 domain-containing protein [Candidatus Malihini olakiniferum]
MFEHGIAFAAKRYGRIDSAEQQRIKENVQELQLSAEARTWIQEAIAGSCVASA